MPIRVVIGCHSYLLGEAVKILFKDEKDVEVVGIFDEGTDISEILKLTPDVILMDFKIFRTFPQDFKPETPMKILLIGDKSWFNGIERQIPDMILRGVFGILDPESNSGALKKAVKIVHSGELWLDRKMLKGVIHHMNPSEKKVNLTKKEKEIVSLICQGLRNKEIAQKLNISEQTVKSHCNRIFKKVGVSDRLQLALYTHKVWPGFI